MKWFGNISLSFNSSTELYFPKWIKIIQFSLMWCKIHLLFLCQCLSKNVIEEELAEVVLIINLYAFPGKSNSVQFIANWKLTNFIISQNTLASLILCMFCMSSIYFKHELKRELKKKLLASILKNNNNNKNFICI